jgi:hypothetical protein
MEQDAHASGPQPLGRVPGLVLGVGAGALLSAVWSFGAWDVALALTMVFLGVTLAVGLGAPGWRPFSLAMLAAAAAVGAAVVMVVV